MRLLLDTHALLWWLDGAKLLSGEARDAIRDERNQVYVSVATAWEIILKKSIGKLIAPNNLEEELIAHRFDRLLITFEHVSELAKLPALHRDPFDRMLIAQSRAENLTLVTKDPNIQRYDIARIFA